MKSKYLLTSFMDSMVDKHMQRFKNPDGGFSAVATQTELSAFNNIRCELWDLLQ
jgi:hypothetical protein